MLSEQFIRPIFVSFGNCLLDMTCTISDNLILKKFNLKNDNACERSMETIQEIIKEVHERYNGFNKVNPGGSALNTSRLLDQLLNVKDQVLFCGSVGQDENADTLKNLLAEGSTLQIELQIHQDHPTGICVCLVQGAERSLVANIGASLYYSNKHLMDSRLENLIRNVQIVYVEGFFVLEKFVVCEYLLNEICLNSNIVFMFNISAPYICNLLGNQFKYLAEKSDIIFGNREEFKCLAEYYKTTSLEELAYELTKSHNKTKKNCPYFKHKLVIMTNGADSIFIYHNNGEKIVVEQSDVPPILPEEIVDTTGAGDGFVAGFVSAYLQGKETLECAKRGTEVAAEVIRNIGCHISSGIVD